MIKAVDHLTPAEQARSDAFFNWEERGFESAWASLVAIDEAERECLGTAYWRLKRALEFLDKRGGLGLDVHEYIRQELHETDAALAKENQ
jgi:hypothetical protein